MNSDHTIGLSEYKTRFDRLDLLFTALGCFLGLSTFGVILRTTAIQPIEYDAAGYWWLAQIASGTDISNFDSQHLTILFNIRLLGYPILIAPFVFFLNQSTSYVFRLPFSKWFFT